MYPSRFGEPVLPSPQLTIFTQTIILRPGSFPVRNGVLARPRTKQQTHGEQVAYVRLLKEAIQGGASSGVVEPVRGIMLCYTPPFLKNQRVPVLLYDPALL